MGFNPRTVTRTTVFESANCGLSQIFHQQNKKIQVYGKKVIFSPVQAKEPQRFNPPLPLAPPETLLSRKVGVNMIHQWVMQLTPPRYFPLKNESE